VILVVLQLVARALLPPPEIHSGIALGLQVLVVVGLLHRSDVARMAALLLAMFAVLRNFPRMLALPLLMAGTPTNDDTAAALIDAAVNLAVGSFVLIAFNGPQARRWTASPPPPGHDGPRGAPEQPR